jgi:peptidoglycan/LPS O-acetylase OafA/YrhL
VACLSVIAYHATGPDAPADSRVLQVTAQLWLGVPLFFVISGYCIAASAEQCLGAQRSIWQYFGRRVRRIFPPFWCATVLTALLTGTIYACGWGGLLSNTARQLDPIVQPQALTVWQWIGNVTLSETWRDQTAAPAWVLGQAWTLAYEEQFYAVTGLFLAAFRRDWLVAAAALSASNLLYCGMDASIGAPRGVFWDGQWFVFAYGLAVYAFVHRSTPLTRACILSTLAAGAGWALTREDLMQPEPLQLLVGAAFATLLIILHPHDALLRGWALRPLQWCGVRCYSIYLLHWPVTKIVVGLGILIGLTSPAQILGIVMPAAILASVAAAAPFYDLVERRFVNAPLRGVDQTVRPVTAAAL